jgi:hypothetical protein
MVGTKEAHVCEYSSTVLPKPNAYFISLGRAARRRVLEQSLETLVCAGKETSAPNLDFRSIMRTHARF